MRARLTLAGLALLALGLVGCACLLAGEAPTGQDVSRWEAEAREFPIGQTIRRSAGS